MDLQTRSVTKVNLRLGGSSDHAMRMAQLQQVLRKHPGPTAVYLTLCLSPEMEADTSPLPSLTVLPTDLFVAEVEHLLGEGTVALL